LEFHDRRDQRDPARSVYACVRDRYYMVSELKTSARKKTWSESWTSPVWSP
jgi:hypothetical protein